MLGRFQNFRVFLGIGRLLLNLPRFEMGECFIEGVEESDIGDTSGLALPLVPLSSLVMWRDSGGETSSGYNDDALGGCSFVGVMSFISGDGWE